MDLVRKLEEVETEIRDPRRRNEALAFDYQSNRHCAKTVHRPSSSRRITIY